MTKAKAIEKQLEQHERFWFLKAKVDLAQFGGEKE